jgi:hypothetical protein
MVVDKRAWNQKSVAGTRLREFSCRDILAYGTEKIEDQTCAIDDD